MSNEIVSLDPRGNKPAVLLSLAKMSNRFWACFPKVMVMFIFLICRTYNKLWVDTQASIKDVINIEDQHQLGRPEKERSNRPN